MQHIKDDSHWEYYRYEKLPNSANSNTRINLERMIIRSYGFLIDNKANIKNFDISEYKLKNSKIDK